LGMTGHGSGVCAPLSQPGRPQHSTGSSSSSFAKVQSDGSSTAAAGGVLQHSRGNSYSLSGSRQREAQGPRTGSCHNSSRPQSAPWRVCCQQVGHTRSSSHPHQKRAGAPWWVDRLSNFRKPLKCGWIKPTMPRPTPFGVRIAVKSRLKVVKQRQSSSRWLRHAVVHSQTTSFTLLTMPQWVASQCPIHPLPELNGAERWLMATSTACRLYPCRSDRHTS